MPRFCFLTWNGAGNQPPAVAIAQALQMRGHEVVFAGYENQRGYFNSGGFRFILLRNAAAAWRDEPPDRMFAVKLATAWASVDHLDDVPDLIAAEQCDVVIADCLMFGALAAVEKNRFPTAALVHSAPGALMPPGGQFESLILRAVNDLRMQAGLAAVESLWEAWARFPALSNSIRQLDPLAWKAPRAFNYLGPFVEQTPPVLWTSPWHSADKRPLVLVSFSTGPYWDQTSRVIRTLAALGDYDCRILVTASSIELPANIVPDNAVVVSRVPHSEILPTVDVVVTHAGHGTVTSALKHGVPMLCLPNSVADQPILADQVAVLGAGLSLDGEAATPAQIRSAIDALLNTPSYKASARRLAREIREAPGVAAAVFELERLADATSTRHRRQSAAAFPRQGA